MPVDQQRFDNACNFVLTEEYKRSGIGTLGEKTLHAALKQYFEPQTDKQEIKVGRYVADILSEKGIIEIQTQGFHTLRKKLQVFLDFAEVTIVYPIPKIKWLCWIDEETGEITKKRRSPKTGKIQDVFFELYKIKQFLTHPNLHVCLVMLELTEYRYLNGWSRDKKKGSSRCDRIPDGLLEEIYIYSAKDYMKMIPETLPESFTAKDFAKISRLNLHSAQIALNILYFLKIVKRTGKIRNSYVYIRTID